MSLWEGSRGELRIELHCMAIDACDYSFAHLASEVLPGHMRRLRQSLKDPVAASTFSKVGVGPSTIAAALGHDADFAGCYVLARARAPFYVGISRKVIARVRQHMLGASHEQASLAYAIAKKRMPKSGTRDSAMSDPRFRREFDTAQLSLRRATVAFVQIDNPLELHLFEPFAAMELDTRAWNTFRTH